MKITKIFLASTIFLFTFFLATNFASADEVTGSVTVIAGACVDVKVDTVDGPILKSTGSSVNVSWSSTNASSCSCTYLKAGVSTSCGTGLFKLDSQPEVISNLLAPTTFTVTCNP